MSAAATPDAVGLGSQPGRDWTPALDALRARGAARLDPVHFRFIEALARRAAAHEGAARRVLDGRLADCVAAVERRLHSAPAAPGLGVPRTARTLPGHTEAAPPRGPLADLVLRIDNAAQPTLALRSVGALADEAGDPGDPGELKAMRYFKSTWSRLRVDRQLKLSLARVPENAGPLHTERLVQRTLQTLRDISPAYLDHFMTQLDTLLWLDAAQGAVPPAPGASGRGAKAAAPKSGRPARAPVGR